MTALIISYTNNRGNPTPTPTFPYEDPLLPGRELPEEVESDLEAGLRRRRKVADYDVEDELWLDEQEAELDAREGEHAIGAGLYTSIILILSRRQRTSPSPAPTKTSRATTHSLDVAITHAPHHPSSTRA
jgi:hypothetical protein